MTTVGVVYNAKSGSGINKEKLVEGFKDLGIIAEIWPLQRSLDIARQAKKAGVSVIVAAGGDGTIRAVASQIIQTNLSLGVLPTGTLNHFAKDMGIPTDIPEAMKVIAAGKTTKVDVAKANGVYFLNNSSIGIYPRLVRRREKSRLGKWPAAAVATVRTLLQHKSYDIEITVDGKKSQVTSPFVFIGNNSYELDGFGLNDRASLTGGTLSIYIVKTESRLRLASVFLRAIFGRYDNSPHFDMMQTTSISLNLTRKTLHVACDGEVEQLNTPLHYIILPGVLNVIVPD